MLVLSLLVFIAACIVLVKCNAILISISSKIAYYFKISELSTGFIVVSLATTMPDLFIGIMSAIKGIPELSVGNILGSGIIKLTLISGIILILAKNIMIEKNSMKKDVLYMLAISLIPVFLMLDHKFWNWTGISSNMLEGISRIDGIILVLIYILYVYLVSNQESMKLKNISVKSKNILNQSKSDEYKQIFLFLLCAALLLLSSNLVVEYAQILAIDLKISTLLFGLFIISFVTSLPELSFETMAVLSGHKALAIGNIIGSVVANSTLVLGITAIIHPIAINSLVYITSILYLVFAAFIFFTFASSENKMTWREGVTLIMIYMIFVVMQKFMGI